MTFIYRRLQGNPVQERFTTVMLILVLVLASQVFVLVLVLVLVCQVLEKSLMDHLKLKVLSCLHVDYHVHTHPVHRQSAYCF